MKSGSPGHEKLASNIVPYQISLFTRHQFNRAFNERATCIHTYTHARQRMHTFIHTYTTAQHTCIHAYRHICTPPPYCIPLSSPLLYHPLLSSTISSSPLVYCVPLSSPLLHPPFISYSVSPSPLLHPNLGHPL